VNGHDQEQDERDRIVKKISQRITFGSRVRQPVIAIRTVLIDVREL
jgi:hypothetical protein